MTEQLIVRNADSYDLDTREEIEADIECYRDEESPGCLRVPIYRVRSWLNRQAAITERECMKQATTRYIGWDCAECAEGLGKELDARCDPLKERIAELTAERDELKAKVDELNASWRKSNDGWAEANAEAERLRHANNTLRASVAGLKLTVDRLSARDGSGRDNPGT